MTNNDATRRQFLAGLTVAGTAALVGVGIALNPSEGEAAGPARQGTSTPLPPGIKSVQGSWFGVLAAPDGRTSRGLATFTSNGGLVTTNQGDTLASRPQGGGHGVWIQNGLHVDTRLLKFVGDEQGVLTYIIEEITSAELDETGDTFTGEASYKMTDMSGAIIEQRNGTITAKRITMTADLTFPS